MSAAAYLRSSTKTAHERTEQIMASGSIIDGSLTAAQYRTLVTALYRTWSAVAHWLQSHMTDAPHLSFVEDMAQALRKDQPVQDDNYLPTFSLDFTQSASQLGVLYVLRGSTLGGRIILGHLRANTALKTLAPFHFYQACENMPPGHWKAFTQLLNESLVGASELERAHQAAEYTFSFLATSVAELKTDPS